MSFPDFMGTALYDPEEGYYARPAGQVGRGGDFFTSVSAGPLFGRLLARHIAEWHASAGSPHRWRIIEIGANDGSLAQDIRHGLLELGIGPGVQQVVIEPLPKIAAALQEKCGDWLTVLDSTADLGADPLPSFVLGNEVLDALPFHMIESDGSAWQELGVSLEGESFTWTVLSAADGELVKHLPVFPAGYRTEIRDNYRSLMEPLLPGMSRGRMLWIDYGFSREDYYHPARTRGTLRTFSKHSADEDPLATPGEIDITAHVDFTVVEDTIRDLGGRVLRFDRQGKFLTEIARPWLLSLEGRTDPEAMKAFRGFQTLTHPGHLGSSFHVMEAAFGD